MTQLELPVSGYCAGPLFRPERKLRPLRVRQGHARRKAVRTRTPSWADVDLIDFIYETARWHSRRTGVLHAVDHVVPVNHPLVCGLHTEDNLRIVTMEENITKGNSWWPDMWGEQEVLL